MGLNSISNGWLVNEILLLLATIRTSWLGSNFSAARRTDVIGRFAVGNHKRQPKKRPEADQQQYRHGNGKAVNR